MLSNEIDSIIHCAGKVGGVKANQTKLGEFFYENAMMSILISHYSWLNGTEKLVTLAAGCGYPKHLEVPYTESDFWNGFPDENSYAYSLAKKNLIVQSWAYREQYDFNSITVFVTNLYGPNDNFQDFTSHVIPAIIKKIWNAKINSKNMIELWGDGTPTRDFLYVDDAAAGLILAAEKYDSVESVNLGTGIETSIQDVAKLIMEIMDINLEIKWNKNMPNGQQRRCVDISKAKNELGFVPKIDLKTGLSKTIDWFTKKQME